MSVLLVDAATAGFEVVRDLPKLGYHGPETCELVFDAARVPAAALLGGAEGRGLQQVLAALETGRINVAARAVGVAQEAYDQALRYAGEREAFGQQISGFQAVQLKLADMAMKVQAARLLVYWAASRADSGQRSDLESGMAKVYASEVAMECAATAMQVHGGYGYSREFDRRAAVPRCAADGHRRGHQRHPPHGHRPLADQRPRRHRLTRPARARLVRGQRDGCGIGPARCG